MNLSPVLQKWISQFPKGQIRILKDNKNHGVSRARNKGIRAGCGRWLAFLDSDDEWLNSKLQKQMRYVENHPEHKLVHTNEDLDKAWNKSQSKKKYTKKRGAEFLAIICPCVVSAPPLPL